MGTSEIALKMLPILLVQHLSKSDRRIEIILAYESKTKLLQCTVVKLNMKTYSTVHRVHLHGSPAVRTTRQNWSDATLVSIQIIIFVFSMTSSSGTMSSSTSNTVQNLLQRHVTRQAP